MTGASSISTPGPTPGAIGSPEHRAYLALQRVAVRQGHEVAELLREHGLSAPQFNVLRILRGAGGEGLTCSEIADRLIVHDPDVTRLLDRLEKAGLITRSRDRADRRMVTCRLTSPGRDRLTALDGPLAALHAAQFAPLPSGALCELLAALEDGAPQP